MHIVWAPESSRMGSGRRPWKGRRKGHRHRRCSRTSTCTTSSTCGLSGGGAGMRAGTWSSCVSPTYAELGISPLMPTPGLCRVAGEGAGQGGASGRGLGI